MPSFATHRLLALGACALLGCSSPTDTKADNAVLRVTDAKAPDAPAGATSPPTVRASAGQVQVLGLLQTPTPCHDVRAEATRAERRITLTVTASPRDVVCVQVVATFAYAAVVPNVAPGRYAVTVRHAYQGAAWPPTTVVDTTVTVP